MKKKLKIIVCDNDEDELMFAKEGFEKSGVFEVMAVADSGDVLMQLLLQWPRQNLPDLVLSDLNMPGRNGFDVLKMITAHDELSAIPVYIFSTSGSLVTGDKCRSFGAVDYLVKPPTFSHYDIFAKALYQKITNTPPAVSLQ